MSAAEILREIDELLAAAPPREMSPERYLEAHVAFRGATNQQRLMLDWIRDELGPVLSRGSEDPLSLLSVGCGSAIFDRPLLEMLQGSPGKINWTGLDPNGAECRAAEEALAPLRGPELSIDLELVRFEDFESDRRYDLVYFVHAFYYFSDVAAMVRRALELAAPGGHLLIFNGPKRELNRLTSLFARRVWGEEGWSERLEEVITEMGLDYGLEIIHATLDVTPCFDHESLTGSLLLDFIAHVDTLSLPDRIREAIVRYLGAVSNNVSGRRLVPHPVTVFLIAGPATDRGARRS